MVLCENNGSSRLEMTKHCGDDRAWEQHIVLSVNDVSSCLETTRLIEKKFTRGRLET